MQKKRKRHAESQDSMSSGELLSSQVATQTTMIQLLQHSERMEEVRTLIKYIACLSDDDDERVTMWCCILLLFASRG